LGNHPVRLACIWLCAALVSVVSLGIVFCDLEYDSLSRKFAYPFLFEGTIAFHYTPDGTCYEAVRCTPLDQQFVERHFLGEKLSDDHPLFQSERPWRNFENTFYYLRGSDSADILLSKTEDSPAVILVEKSVLRPEHRIYCENPPPYSTKGPDPTPHSEMFSALLALYGCEDAADIDFLRVETRRCGDGRLLQVPKRISDRESIAAVYALLLDAPFDCGTSCVEAVNREALFGALGYYGNHGEYLTITMELESGFSLYFQCFNRMPPLFFSEPDEDLASDEVLVSRAPSFQKSLLFTPEALDQLWQLLEE